MKTISLLTFAASVAFAASAGQAFAAGDAAAGEKVFAKCKACHQVGEGAKNAVAPQRQRQTLFFGSLAASGVASGCAC